MKTDKGNLAFYVGRLEGNWMFLAHKIVAAKIVITGAVLVTAGTVLTAAALSDPKCRDKLKEYAEKFRNGTKNT
ncbi:MAG: hypothetical protein CML52_04370 [Rhodobacteraceae bacterium]|nr:hypothetical protein [Paracoccaceae bacterium]